MKRCEETKINMWSLSLSEMGELETVAQIVSESKIEKQDYSVLRAIEWDCPICDKVHLVEERKRSTQAFVKDEIVDYEEIFYCCTNLQNNFRFEFSSKLSSSHFM